VRRAGPVEQELLQPGQPVGQGMGRHHVGEREPDRRELPGEELGVGTDSW
jgi:hypothetical protein